MSDNLFEYAARNKIRFPSPKGDLTAEHLWDVPLRSRDDFNLNTVAKATNAAWKSATEENFVDDVERAPAARKRVEVAFAIVKHVIDTKRAEEEAAKASAAKRQEKEQLYRILAEAETAALSKLSVEEIRQRIAALGE